jgi:hypothetical protein
LHPGTAVYVELYRQLADLALFPGGGKSGYGWPRIPSTTIERQFFAKISCCCASNRLQTRAELRELTQLYFRVAFDTRRRETV